MPRLELPAPVRMQRIALAMPRAALRRVLVDLAAGGRVELAGDPPPPEGDASDAMQRLAAVSAAKGETPVLLATEPHLKRLESSGAGDLLAGEVELDRRRRLALTQGDVPVLVGWTPAGDVSALRETLAREGAALVELPRPAEPPPTLLRSARIATPFRVLVDTYGVLPYSDVDPTAFAALAFILMFGMMFGDAGHGALLVLIGLALSRVRGGRFAAVRPAWPIVTAAGAAGLAFGLLYGEIFGPTGIVRPLWFAPLDHPLSLLRAGIIAGSVLLSISYLLGFINRWRERGPGTALFAEGGLAGGLVFAGVAIAALSWSRSWDAGIVAGAVTAGLGLALVFIGTLLEAGGGTTGLIRAAIEVMDTAIRIGSNIVSFARLAAFGLTHAALSLVTLEGVRRLAGRGMIGWIGAGLVFVLGTLVALALEGLVAGIQALRLEYYELFSRVFEGEGRPFAPFHLPVRSTEGQT